jgi:hypothetical protein
MQESRARAPTLKGSLGGPQATEPPAEQQPTPVERQDQARGRSVFFSVGLAGTEAFLLDRLASSAGQVRQ